MNRVEMLLDMMQTDKNDPFLPYALSLEYVKSGQSSQSIELLQKLSASHPEYLPTYYQLGKLLEASGKFSEAIAVYRKGEQLATEQRDLKTKSELAEAIWELEDYS
ncbi:MAG: hypothetical protein P8O05_07215 [Flavobacteriales bacterium]|nr:hypothetical protein [Flavobacteriales bacterium]MDG2244893.1 hypothetical protein [Flavobacteriales bacterium]